MKLLIITGGSRGLGWAISEQCKNKGYKILEFSRSAPHEYSIQTDLANPEQSRQTVANTIAGINVDELDELIVISNAATLHPIGPASTKFREDLTGNMNINFVSAILIISEIVAKFQPSSCRKVIANISSAAALKGTFGESLYCAAKAGMENFIRSLAIEQQTQPHPFIPINIDPGAIDTEMQAYLRATSQSDFLDRERFIQRKEQGLLGCPHQVAATILQILNGDSLSFGERYRTFDAGVENVCAFETCREIFSLSRKSAFFTSSSENL